MTVPDRELGLHRDTVHVLGEFEGPSAANLMAHTKAMIESGARRLPEREPTSPELDASFREQCETMISAHRVQINEILSCTPSAVVLQVPILLGQSNYVRRELSPGPNLYASEIELLASGMPVQDRKKTTRAQVRGALEALRLAREINIASSVIPGNESDRVIERAFAASGIFTRGRFYGAYDKEFLRRLHGALASVGLQPLDPTRLQSITQTVMQDWLPVYGDLHRSSRKDPLLRNLLSNGSLLQFVPKMLDAPDTLDTIANLSDRLWLKKAVFMEGFVSSEREEMEGWIDELSFDLASVVGDGDRPAIDRPVASADDELLVIAPHRINTDATELLDRLWGSAYGEKYYRQRGALVEDIAFEVLSEFPESASIKGGSYEARDLSVAGECDGVVKVRDTLFIIEAKGGYISPAARSGSVEAARSDIQSTVSEAYFQAARLAKLLFSERSVRLTAKKESLLLRAEEIQRVHVVIPTADDMGAIATSPQMLVKAGYLPTGAAPAVLAAQDLLKIRDLLPNVLDRLAYFRFREESLGTTPVLLLRDESEILGGYIAGVDFVSHVEELGDVGEFGAVQPDIVLQRHVDSWLDQKYENHSTALPPRRHDEWISARIADLASRDLRAGIMATLASRSAAQTALTAPATLAPSVTSIGGFSVISSPGLVRRGALSRNPEVRKARRRSWQIWTVVHRRNSLASLTSVMRAPRSLWVEPEFQQFGRPSPVAEWFESYAARRRTPVDAAQVRSLEELGIPRDAATGLVRRGIHGVVNRACVLGAMPSKVAARCLDELSDVLAILDWKADLERVAIAIVAIANSSVSRDDSASAFRRIVVEGVSPETVIQELEVSQEDSLGVVDAFSMACSDHPEAEARARAGDQGAVRFLAGQTAKRMRPAREPFETVAERVRDLLANPEVDRV